MNKQNEERNYLCKECGQVHREEINAENCCDIDWRVVEQNNPKKPIEEAFPSNEAKPSPKLVLTKEQKRKLGVVLGITMKVGEKIGRREAISQILEMIEGVLERQRMRLTRENGKLERHFLKCKKCDSFDKRCTVEEKRSAVIGAVIENIDSLVYLKKKIKAMQEGSS